MVGHPLEHLELDGIHAPLLAGQRDRVAHVEQVVRRDSQSHRGDVLRLKAKQ